ncbi:MAG: Uma2 family endonuclease [Planctomycetota bacterium]
MTNDVRNDDLRTSSLGEPTWEMVSRFPLQGQWTVEEYLPLDMGRLVEFVDGKLEFVPMPTELHQAIAFFLCTKLTEFIVPRRLGVAFVAPLRVRVAENRFREPDVLFMRTENRSRRRNRFWEGADLVMEIVSEDDPDRDLVLKRQEYEKAGITEYWIIDPRDRSVTVLALDETSGRYQEFARLTDGQTAQSSSIEGFDISVSEIFDRPEMNA